MQKPAGAPASTTTTREAGSLSLSLNLSTSEGEPAQGRLGHGFHEVLDVVGEPDAGPSGGLDEVSAVEDLVDLGESLLRLLRRDRSGLGVLHEGDLKVAGAVEELLSLVNGLGPVLDGLHPVLGNEEKEGEVR